MITPDAPPARVLEIASAAVRGGADAVQLRHKTLARGELLDLARAIRAVFPLSGKVPGEAGAQGQPLFVVNDFVDIALLSGADGVHLGPDDLSVAGARRVAGDRLLIGVSASTPDAVQRGADYVGCGPAFATPIKSEKRVIGPAGVAAMTSAASIPVFAIGGIDESNIAQLVVAGVHRVCVLRAVADAPDPEAATRRLRAMLTA